MMGGWVGLCVSHCFGPYIVLQKCERKDSNKKSVYASYLERIPDYGFGQVCIDRVRVGWIIWGFQKQFRSKVFRSISRYLRYFHSSSRYFRKDLPCTRGNLVAVGPLKI